MNKQLTISGSPHIHTRRDTAWCMRQVAVALLPAVACSLYYFGLGAAIVIATSIAGCMLAEYTIERFLMNRRSSLGDCSAMLTGLLLALNLPSNLPIWTVLIGCFVAIGVGKMAFGGLGCNIFNPALVGRVFLLLSFPALMTSWPLPEVNRMVYLDATTGATVLSGLKMGAADGSASSLLASAMGAVGGSLGEVGSIALLLGGIYLLCRRVITWHIPVSIIVAMTAMSLAFGMNVGVELLSGGLLLGAIFMATDYVTSPMSHVGMVVYGVMIGVITFVIRQWGSYPEGVSFAILLMNGATPLINRICRPRMFGERRGK